MAYLFQSWKESLSLVMGENAKLFSLVTIKTIFESYKTYFKHFWWLLLFSGALDIISARYFGTHGPFLVLPLVSWLITIFGMYLVVRPSIKQKGLEYYKDNIKKFFSFALYSLSFSLFLVGMLMLLALMVFLIKPSLMESIILENTHYLGTLLLTPFLLPSSLIIVFVSPLLTFCILFMLDGDGSIKNFFKSMLRALKMGFYNYPFCLLFLVLFLAFSFAAQLAMHLIFGHPTILNSAILSHSLLLIPLSIWSTLYTKRLHDQFTLYYPEARKE